MTAKQRRCAPRRRRRQQWVKRRISNAILEILCGIIIGLALAGLLVLGFMFDINEPPSPPEHYGQIEYCGVWFDVDDYHEMMEERAAYLQRCGMTENKAKEDEPW